MKSARFILCDPVRCSLSKDMEIMIDVKFVNWKMAILKIVDGV